ncbi:MAG TPA: AAA family ATPase, partial [Candidatus Dormibacteraeota bacterium]|nr:AAA family ATPase [Candidatus Dormibacteraeota bacterium]
MAEAMPLRAKPGQSTITVIVDGDDAAVRDGRRRAKELADYYAAAGIAPLDGPRPDSSAAASSRTPASPAAEDARAYFGEGAVVGPGGRWCVAARRDGPGLPTWTAEALEQLGVLPSQPWSGERLEALLRGAGRRGFGRTADRRGVLRPAVRTHAWIFDLAKSFSLLSVYGEEPWLLATLERAARVATDLLVTTAELVRRREGPRIVHERAAALHYSLVLERTARSAMATRLPGIEASGVPGLHFHAHLLFHFAVDDRGRLCAVDVDDALQHGWRRLASAVADAMVVGEARRRGIPLRLRAPERPGASWTAEVATIPDAAVEASSERHRVIVSARAGAAGAGSDRSAERLTKAAKERVVDMEALVRHWRAVIEAHGACDPTRHRSGDPLSAPLDDIGGVIADALAATFATRSVATWQEIVADLLLRAAPVWDGEQLWRLVSTLPASLEAAGDLVGLTGGRLTHCAVLDQEERILALWRSLADKPVEDLRHHLPAAFAEHHEATGQVLDNGQAQLVGGALQRGVVLGVGVAGAGKTSALAVLGRAAADAGRRLHVIALAALRARESRLLADADADCSVEAILSRIEAGTFAAHVAAGDVIVVDEASQLGDDALETILTACAEHRVRLVLLGDPRQQTAVERGAMFVELARRGRCDQWPEYVELLTAHRFADPAMAEALASFRAGDAVPLADYLAPSGGLVETQSPDDSIA